MFREGYTKPGVVTTVNVLISDGGLGDLLCASVPLNHLLEKCFWLNPLIWVPDYLVEFYKNVLPSKAKVYSYTEGKKRYNEKLPGLSTQWDNKHSPMRTHPVDYGYHTLVDYTPTASERNYLKLKPVDITKFNLPNKYVCIGVGHTNKSKEFKPDVVNGIVTYALSQGYTPIFLGKKEAHSGFKTVGIKAEMPTDIDYSKGIDLTDQTSVIEAGSIIARSACYIGMDGGLVHLAGFTDVPIVSAYTFINPNHIMPIRNDVLGYNVFPITPDASLGCRFCQTNWKQMYEHSFFDCYYDDWECVKQITLDKWVVELEKVL